MATIVGTAGHDILDGTSAADEIHGLEGDDTLRGGDDGDELLGGAGDDMLYGDAGNDLLDGGSGDNRMYGGDGDDTARIVAEVPVRTGLTEAYLGAGHDRLIVDYSIMTQPIVMRFPRNYNDGWEFGIDIGAGWGVSSSLYAMGVNGLTLTTGSGNDEVHLITATDIVSTGAGDDWIWSREAGADPDAFRATGGTRIDAGTGFDRAQVDWSDLGASQPVILDTADPTGVTIGIGADQRYLRGVEVLSYFRTGEGDDRITLNPGFLDEYGSTQYQYLWTHGGDDVLTIRGGARAADNGFFHPYLGDGGDDHLILDFSASLDPISMSSAVIRPDGFGMSFGGVIHVAGKMTVSEQGSERVTIIGGAANDIIGGTARGDVLRGNGGNDYFYITDDFSVGTAVTDLVEGGAGFDTLRLHLQRHLDVSAVGTSGPGAEGLGGADGALAIGDLIVNFKAMDRVEIATDLGRNVIRTGGSDDRIETGEDDDTIEAGDGDDYLDGGSGADSLAGGAGDDVYVIDAYDTILESPDQGIDEIRTWMASYSLAGSAVENLTGTYNWDQTLTGNELANVVDGGEGADIVAGGDGDDDVVGGIGADTLHGGNDDDRLYSHLMPQAGQAGDPALLAADTGTVVDSLFGEAGADRLFAGYGDSVDGGADDDTLLISFQGATSGVSADFRLLPAGMTIGGGTIANVEAVEWIEGSEYDDMLALANVAIESASIHGRGGNDALYGNQGNDRLAGGSGADALHGGAGADMLNAEGGDPAMLAADTGTAVDSLFGEAGSDRLVAGYGDSVDGGADDDTLLISFRGATAGVTADFRLLPAGMTIGGGTIANVEAVEWIEGSEYDDMLVLANVALASASIYGRGGNDSLYGNQGSDRLFGGSGTDLLHGGGGIDQMEGGLGDDLYMVDAAGDRIVELAGEGIDTVHTLASYALSDHVEHLVLAGGGHIGGTGNALANTVTGNNGNNRLDGRAGADTMAGGKGHDTYIVDHVADQVVEGGSSGNDTVESSVSYRLPVHFEKLILTGIFGYDGRGNAGANTITGNSGGNLLSGGSGNDIIDGGAGKDDLLGGPGTDRLTGGAGDDRFFFNFAPAAANIDRILDFAPADDAIYLHRSVFAGTGPNGALAASAFHNGSAAADANDRILYDAATGNIFYDRDGTGAAAAVLFATVTAGTPLTHADFMIYG